ncbi:aldehyde dehydrogenase family protein [Thermoflexus sp.]|uniref:aldehyde dehydrogenase family protein n=1 Tax=Thermoflexus sp. TaxID=1969742 RepID=UPI00331823D2
MRKLHLELGGKDPFGVGPDAPLEMAVRALAYAALINAGQVCASTERAYGPEAVYHRFAEEIAALVSTPPAGPWPGSLHRHQPDGRLGLPGKTIPSPTTAPVPSAG